MQLATGVCVRVCTSARSSTAYRTWPGAGAPRIAPGRRAREKAALRGEGRAWLWGTCSLTPRNRCWPLACVSGASRRTCYREAILTHGARVSVPGVCPPAVPAPWGASLHQGKMPRALPHQAAGRVPRSGSAGLHSGGGCWFCQGHARWHLSWDTRSSLSTGRSCVNHLRPPALGGALHPVTLDLTPPMEGYRPRPCHGQLGCTPRGGRSLPRCRQRPQRGGVGQIA